MHNTDFQRLDGFLREKMQFQSFSIRVAGSYW